MSPLKPQNTIRKGMPTRIVTQRLLLRMPTLDDVPAMQAAKEAAWPALQRWMSWSGDDQYGIEPLRIRTINSQHRLKKGEELSLIGVDRYTGEFIISTGLRTKDALASRYETGYWVAPHLENKGYATETLSAISHFAFAALGINRLEINHFHGNEGSRRVIEKCGFTYEGPRPRFCWRPSDGVLVDVHEFVRLDASHLPHPAPSWS